MLLEGSCHCGAVRFSVEAHAPVPFMRCYCSICRKTQGGGGYSINLGGYSASLKVSGEDSISVYNAVIDGETSAGERRFCSKCGSGLWLFDPRWPDLVHPFASAIDSDLPESPEHVHIMLASVANWVPVEAGPGDRKHDEYPDQSLREWHATHDLLDED